MLPGAPLILKHADFRFCLPWLVMSLLISFCTVLIIDRQDSVSQLHRTKWTIDWILQRCCVLCGSCCWCSAFWLGFRTLSLPMVVLIFHTVLQALSQLSQPEMSLYSRVQSNYWGNLLCMCRYQDRYTFNGTSVTGNAFPICSVSMVIVQPAALVSYRC